MRLIDTSRGRLRHRTIALLSAAALAVGLGVVGTGAAMASPTPKAAAVHAASAVPAAVSHAATSETGTIVGNNSGLCLSVTGSSTSAGALTDIYTCNGSASE